MNVDEQLFQRVPDGQSEHIWECDSCGDVILTMEGTSPKVCCGEEMSPSSELSVDRSEVRVQDTEHLLRAVFGIGRTAVEVCFHVLEANEATAEEIADRTGLDRSGVARHLTHLYDLGLINRSTENLEDGGLVHVYTAPSPTEVQHRPQLLFFRWAADALTILDALNEQKLDLLTSRQSYSSDRIYWDSVGGG